MGTFFGINLYDEVMITRPSLPVVTDVVAYVSDKRLVTRNGYRLYFEDGFEIKRTGKSLDPSAFGLTRAFWQPQITPAALHIIEEARQADMLAFSTVSDTVE